MRSGNQAKVFTWMLNNKHDFVDKKTDEIDLTKLAEAAADHFDLYGDDDDATIPDWVFDCAVEADEA